MPRLGAVHLPAAAAGFYQRLVLGAWGCGVFRNGPEGGGAFRTHLAPGGRFAGAFDRVVFGILDRTRDSAVRAAFERTFADLLPGPAAISSSRTAPAAADVRD